MKTWYIYKITNLLTGKSYVGQRLLRKNTPLTDNYMGSGFYLKLSIKKHGLNNFKKEILKDNIKCQTAANIFEEIFIKKENTMTPSGYNLKNSCLQCEYSKESKEKMSKASKGKPKTEKHKKSLSIARKGEKLSETHKKNIGLGNKGKIVSKESRKKMIESWKVRKLQEVERKKNGTQRERRPSTRKNFKHSEESKLKMSEAHKGKSSPNKGKHHSEEAKLKNE
jgi:hypothetical protein